jgi:hypothetical protein
VTFNHQQRAKLYRQASHIVLSQGGMIPVGQQLEYGILKPWVHGLVKTPFNAWGT